MLTGELRSKVDRLWDAFWSGGISNPLTVIEQITYLLFIKRLDEIQTRKESQASFTGKPLEAPIFRPEEYHLRWSQFKNLDAESLYRLMTQEKGVFNFMKELATERDAAYARYMKGATFMIPTPSLLERVVSMLSVINMDDRDTKGDLYEYLLSKIASAGQNGQFRTPRHIIKMMVQMMKPTPQDTICDPSMGSAGFLVAAGEYLREKHPETFHRADLREHYHRGMFHGFEFDATMIRIGAMNLILHGIEQPNLIDRDSLSGATAGLSERFSLILANPPFTGSLDYGGVDPQLLRVVKTKKTELLFLALILRLMKVGGRAAVIVPDGVMAGVNAAFVTIRREIIEKQKLEAVISMPSGIFKPYAGVSTAILIFTKTNSGGTDQVWFYDMRADGFSLDDKRHPVAENDIPDILTRWENRNAEASRSRTEKSFMVPLADIEANGYDLSINRYKKLVYAEQAYETPKAIMESIRQIDELRNIELNELEELLG
jgi:type I restriction enzyme M protein